MGTRRNFSAELEAKVALESLVGDPGMTLLAWRGLPSRQSTLSIQRVYPPSKAPTNIDVHLLWQCVGGLHLALPSETRVEPMRVRIDCIHRD